MIKLYRKKPVEIQAEQFTGGNYQDIVTWITDLGGRAGGGERMVTIMTLEGNMQASVGDYIIKGVKGEFYPCKPDIFAETYDEVEHGAA